MGRVALPHGQLSPPLPHHKWCAHWQQKALHERTYLLPFLFYNDCGGVVVTGEEAAWPRREAILKGHSKMLESREAVADFAVEPDYSMARFIYCALPALCCFKKI